MKKLTEWLHLTERTKLIVNVAAAAALLLAAMLVPLAFRTEEPAVETTDAPRRAEIFQRYLAGDDSVAVERIETPEAELTAACETRMHTLAARCIDDREAELDGMYKGAWRLPMCETQEAPYTNPFGFSVQQLLEREEREYQKSQSPSYKRDKEIMEKFAKRRKMKKKGGA